MGRRVTPVMLAVWLLFEVAAAAQTGEGRVEVGGGVRWLGGTSYPRVSATETSLANGRFTLFDSDTRLEPATRVEARVGARLTSVLQMEGAFSYSRPELQTRITSDVEGISDVTLTDRITEYTFEGGITAQLARWSFGRLAPFAAGGLGYLRQLHDGHGLVETGQTYYVGGGFRVPFSLRRGLVKASGIRADARAQFSRNGVALDEDTRIVPSLSASFFVRF
ncbi:MAG: outer membrane beta-barrel protein [Luteitalea sp.]|nr:outer membrane beta-barrel protein [Luteitalea sp.]